MLLLYSILINEKDYYPKLRCSCLQKQIIRITIKSENKSRKFNENLFTYILTWFVDISAQQHTTKKRSAQNFIYKLGGNFNFWKLLYLCYVSLCPEQFSCYIEVGILIVS